MHQVWIFHHEVKETKDMSTLEQIEAAILTLGSDEFQRLRHWFFDVDYQRWDEQLEQDVVKGKLDALAKEAIAACRRQ